MTRENERKIRRGEKAITHLQKLNLIYLLGGARTSNGIVGPRGRGVAWTDCSGFVGFILRVIGVKLKSLSPLWTGTLKDEGEPGEGNVLTLYIKEPLNTEGHVIMRLRHHPRWRKALGLAAKWRWAECGGMDNPHPGGGPTWFKPTDARIAEFPIRRHFPELER